MLRALLVILVFQFIYLGIWAQTHPIGAFDTNPEEIVQLVNSGNKDWLSNDSLRFKVLKAFTSTKQKELPQLPSLSWENWLLTQNGIPVVEAYVLLARFKSRQGEFSQASTCLELAHKELISIEDHAKEWQIIRAEYLDSKAEVDWMAGHPIQAIEALNLALIKTPENDFELSPAMRARMSNNMGILQWHLGEMDEALDYFNRALKSYKEIHGETHPKTGRCYNNLGVVLLHLGDLALARNKFEKALEIGELDASSFGLRSLIHNNLGVIFLAENEAQKALDHFERSFEELEKGQIGNTKYELDVWRFSAEAYLATGDTAAALDAMRQALKITSSVEGELGIHAAELYTQLSKIEPAHKKSHLFAAAECMKTEGVTSHGNYAGILQAIGDDYMDAENEDSAYSYYEQGHRILLQKLHKGEIEKELITSYSRLAKWTYQKESFGESTIAYWDSSLFYMDDLRTKNPFPDSRDNFFKIGNEVYPEALAQATSTCKEKVKHSDIKGEEIFKLIEHSKSFTFSEHLLNQRMYSGTKEGRQNRSRLAEYNFLRERINQLESGSEEELELRIRLNELAESISKSSTAPQLIKKSSPPGLNQVQAALLSDEVFLTYYMGPSTTYAFATQKDDYLWWSIATDTLETLIAQQKELLSSLETALDPSYDGQLQTNLVALYDFLISPVMEQFEVNTLLYSMHDQLYAANLNCLVSESDSSPLQSWNYLIKSTNLISIASSWQIVQREGKGQWKGYQTGIWASDFARQTQLSTLKNATREAQIINGIRSSDLLLNADCKKASFLKNVGRYEVVHLALHGSAGNYSQEGCLYFESGDSTEILKLSELMGLGISNHLTVLGSCRGGSGSWALGETANSLTKAFLTAGSKQVIHSKWELEDAMNVELMRALYTGLKKGVPPSEALRSAQISWLNSGAETMYMHPHFWAGLELSGPDPKINVTLLDLVSWRNGIWFAALIMVVVWLFFRTKR